MGKNWGVLVAVALVFAGCGSTGDQAGTSTVSSTTSTTAPARGTPKQVTMSGPIAAGRHRLVAFAPPIELTVLDDGWYVGQPGSTFAAINRYPSKPDAYVVVLRPTQVFDASYPNPDPVPADVGQWLHDHPGLSTTAFVDVTLDGRPARRFDATVTGADRTCDLGKAEDSPCVVLAPIPENEDFHFAAGERIRFWILDLEGPVVIAVSDRPDHFGEFLPQAEAVIASLSFG